ncbi:MAG: family 78 glycoside hydrolase catalytic domain [Aggregatilineales bacterium]
MDSPYNWQGMWVWDRDAKSPNSWLYFRRELSVEIPLSKCLLHITADTTYELFINGHRIGRGPARGYPFRYFYDTYDITSYIVVGEALVVGVIVNHLGDHSMCYMKGEPGFLCDIILQSRKGQTCVVGTDADWDCLPYAPIDQDAPRISKQLEFEEHYDARQEAAGWTLPEYDAGHWKKANVIRPVEPSPVPRDIPFLTETPLAPVRLLAAELAKRNNGLAWTLDVRELAGTDHKGLESAVPERKAWLIYSEIVVEQPCEARIRVYPDYEFVEFRVNEQTFRPFDKFHPKTWTVDLQAGSNLVMMRNAKWPALFIECDAPFTLTAGRALPGAAWVFAGPFDERESDARWDVSRLEDIDTTLSQQAITDADNRLDVFVETTSQTYFAVENGFCHPTISAPHPRIKLPDSKPLDIHRSDAFLHDNADWTHIDPHPDGDLHLVIDFGQEVIGYIEFEIDASEGTILDANCFEAIDDSGIYWMGSMRNTFRYICRDGLQTWRSHRRRGFRYMSLTVRNLERPLRIRHLRLYQSTYPVSHRGTFHSSDTTLNTIWEVSAYTVQLCMLDTYVDCPGFEQVFWVGDARHSALVNATAFGDYDLTARCNRLVADSLSSGIQAIIPDFYTHRQQLTASHVVSGWFDEIPMWTFLWVWTVWEHYLYTGDTQSLATLYPAVQACLDRAETMLSSRDLFAIENAWNMMDHAANDNERYGEIIGNSVMFVRALETAVNIGQSLGENEKSAHYQQVANRVRHAVNRYGWSEEYGAFVDTVRDQSAYTDYTLRCTQTDITPLSFDEFRQKQRISEQTNTLALLCGCVPPERYESVIPFVLAATEGKFVASRTDYAYLGSPDKVVAVGSPWFLFFTLETLFEQGYSDEALTIIRDQWKKMLDKGATTFWETFPGEVSKGHWSRSMCHGWSSAPVYFLSTHILGVQPTAPGFAKVRIAPKPFDLTEASGTVPTPHGAIYVSWFIDSDGQFHLHYDAPAECDVEVVLPASPVVKNGVTIA